jgi:hypothetical protein
MAFFSSAGSWRARPSVPGVVEHPAHPIFISELTEGGAPKTLMERRFHRSVDGEFLEEALDLFVRAAIEAKEYRIAWFGVCPEHVGTHDQGFAVLCEVAMEDIGGGFGGHFCGHRRFGYFLEA